MMSDFRKQSEVETIDQAIGESSKLSRWIEHKEGKSPMTRPQIVSQMRLLIDKVMGEAALYAPVFAADAIQLSGGSDQEAVVMVRAFRETLERKYESETIDTRDISVLRRISSAFREIPGGQILGPTRDYTQRLLETHIAYEEEVDIEAFLSEVTEMMNLQTDNDKPLTIGKVSDLLRKEGLLRPVEEEEDRSLFDVTRKPLEFPAPRSAALQTLASGETGGIMALAYSAMRGYGGDHPTIGELRYGRTKVVLTDRLGRKRTFGRIEFTESENISKIKVKKKDPVPYMSMGYGLCFGHNETKAICMGILDRSMRIPGDHAPAVSQEYVLHHVDGAAAFGSVNSSILPGQVELGSELNLIRQSIERKMEKKEKATS